MLNKCYIFRGMDNNNKKRGFKNIMKINIFILITIAVCFGLEHLIRPYITNHLVAGLRGLNVAICIAGFWCLTIRTADYFNNIWGGTN